MNKQTAHLLQQHFDTAFAAPDGIKKLRELILTLAMQGKLVEQNPNDPPASELLKAIETEKQRLVKEGKIKQPKPLPPIKPEDVPYELPKGWAWVRLGQICSYIQRGKGPTYAEFSEHRVISQKCVRWYGLDLEPARYIETASLEKYEPIRFLRVGDLLWNSTGTGTIGRACLVPQELEEKKIVTDSHVTVVRLIETSPLFLWRWIQSPVVQNEIESSASGTTNQIELNTSTVINHLMPLPPLPEQKRIVARIDQLMARCDELEQLRAEREQKRLAVHNAVIRQLLDAPDGSVWEFIHQHFGELYTVKDNVAKLRKAILQLAVMGRLVPQNPNDPPASELVKEIEVVKQRLVKSRQLKIGQKTEDSKFICDDTKIPKTWGWVKGVEILFITKLAGFEYTKYVNLQDEGEVPVIRAQNVRQFFIDATNLKFIDLKTSELLERCALTRQALLVTFIGAGIGDVALFDMDERWHLAPNVAKMELFVGCENKLNLRYLNYFLLSPLGRREIFKHLKSTAQPSISMGTIRDIDYPLPPLPEQHRIVARIDQLMALCDGLDQQIDAVTAKQTELLGAVMAQV